jgi:hypothetical protein
MTIPFVTTNSPKHVIKLQPLPWLDEQFLTVEPLQPFQDNIYNNEEMESDSAPQTSKTRPINSDSLVTTFIGKTNNAAEHLKPLLVLKGLSHLVQYPPFQKPLATLCPLLASSTLAEQSECHQTPLCTPLCLLPVIRQRVRVVRRPNPMIPHNLSASTAETTTDHAQIAARQVSAPTETQQPDVIQPKIPRLLLANLTPQQLESLESSGL